MQDAGQILQFLRPGGIPTALLIFLMAWLLVRVLQSVSEQLGNRLVDRRLTIISGCACIR